MKGERPKRAAELKKKIMKTKQTKNNQGFKNRSDIIEQPSQAKTQTTAASAAPAPDTTTTAPALDNQKAQPTDHWRAIFFHGPEPAQDRQTGDEIPSWSVYVGNADADPRGKVYTVYSFSRAQALAEAMSKDRSLKLVADAQPPTPLPARAAA